mgnify:CR=1 FL=1
MSRDTIDLGRRNAVRTMLGGMAAVPLVQLVGVAVANAEDLPHLAEDDPAAAGLGYKHDASEAARVDKAGVAAGEQFCKNCSFVQSDDGAWRPCAIFPGKLVNQNGWCTAWAPKA